MFISLRLWCEYIISEFTPEYFFLELLDILNTIFRKLYIYTFFRGTRGIYSLTIFMEIHVISSNPTSHTWRPLDRKTAAFTSLCASHTKSLRSWPNTSSCKNSLRWFISCRIYWHGALAFMLLITSEQSDNTLRGKYDFWKKQSIHSLVGGCVQPKHSSLKFRASMVVMEVFPNGPFWCRCLIGFIELEAQSDFPKNGNGLRNLPVFFFASHFWLVLHLNGHIFYSTF
jgi:hypothetical protein